MQQSYWALALPLAVIVFFVLGLSFWVGYTIATIRVEPFDDGSETHATEPAPGDEPEEAAPHACPAAGRHGHSASGWMTPPARRLQRLRSHSLKIALLTYRGNMYCGGQGIYAAYLAREWQRAGHEVHVIAGPPLPELAPGIPLHVIPNLNVFGQEHPDWLNREDPFAHFDPLSLWELGVSQLRRLPGDADLRAAAAAALARAAERASASTWSSTTSACRGACSAFAPAGVPVVSVIHHPLHIDREADFSPSIPRW